MPEHHDPGTVCTYTLLLQQTRQHKAGPLVRIERVPDRAFVQYDSWAKTIIRRNNDEAEVKESVPMVWREHRLRPDSEIPTMKMQGYLLS